MIFKRALKQFILFLIPVLICVFLSFYAYFRLLAKAYISNVKNNEQRYLDLESKLIINSFHQVLADILYLSNVEDLLEINEADYDENTIRRLAKTYLAYIKRESIYDQIRWLSPEGKEIIRVNFNNGHPDLIPENQLQDKSQRYYFKETVKLKKGEFYISPMDLNMENDKIEKPYKPMIRISTPVYNNSGKLKGVVVLNYFGNEIFKKIESVSMHLYGKIMLLNSDGYWMYGSASENLWAFMFDDKKDLKFSRYYPAVWEKSAESKEGCVDASGGLFCYKTIYPLRDDNLSYLLSQQNQAGNYSSVEMKDFHWLLVSHVSPQTLYAGLKGSVRNLTIAAVLVTLLLIVALWLLAASRVRRLIAEERLNRLSIAVEQSAHVIIITDLKGNIVFANKAIEKATGYSQEEIIGKNTRLFKSGYHTQADYKVLWETLKSGNVWHGQFLNKRKDGSTFWEEAVITPIKNSKGEIINYIAVKEDITRRKEAEEELKQAKEEAEAANRLKSEFLANMSHEIRTPMNAILGFTEILIDEEYDPTKLEKLEVIKNSGINLLNLINDILDFSKIEAGKIELEKANFGFKRLIEHIKSIFINVAEEKDLDFKVVIHPSVPAVVVGDEHRINQIILNIL
ncbi:MAG: PAS domain S-box protein, partial [Spirochaetota bacterium]